MLRLLACALAIAGAAGCGSVTPPLPPVCTDVGQGAVEEALRAAPGHVALSDGTRLSACIERAGTDGAELQVVGAAYTAAGDHLARTATRDPEAALRLGYLVGATGRGASRTNGLGSELAYRMGHLLSVDEAAPAARGAYARGRAAGAAGG